MKKFSLILASYAEYKLLFLVLFFSNYWPLLSNILAVPQVPEERHCLKRNTYTSLDLNSVILNKIWRCHVFEKPKQPKKRLFWFKAASGSQYTQCNIALPSICKEVRFKPKSSHSLRVTCVSTLFNAGVEEKLIRDRTGHRSNALFKYEKVSEMKSG